MNSIQDMEIYNNKKILNAYVIENLNIFFKKNQILKNINMEIQRNKVTSFIGPSGCGKSTILKSLNRMHDYVPGFKIEGKILYDGKDVYKEWDPYELRTKVGMVFQKPSPFPFSIYDNVAYGPRIHGIHNKQKLNKIVEKSLKQAALWDEVKDKLNENAMSLSGGQQQRLCISRAIALDPDILLMDEPTSALDPISTLKIENLILSLRKKFTIIIVTHSMKQASHISDRVFFLLNGKLVESGKTKIFFTKPKNLTTEKYITGRPIEEGGK